MMANWQVRRSKLAGLVVLAGAALLLAGCLLLPGRFTSDLALRKDGTFSFAYTGEVFFLPLSKMADGMGKAASEPFKAECKDDNNEDRPCSAAETAEQKDAWQSNRDAEDKRKTREREGMKAMLGGLDPSDPRAAEMFAERLSKQAGWKKVVNKGDGRFEVEFAISGRLDHDFTFPTIERLPMLIPFVTLVRRADGTVRMEAPGFAPSQGAGLPMLGMLGGAGKPGLEAGMPQMDGRLTLRTDGAILANNTENGPQPDRGGTVAGGQMLEWAVNPQSAAPPTALVRVIP